MRTWIGFFSPLVVLIALAAAEPAAAQTQDAAGAEALFREGREFANSGDFVRACAKFHESNRLDPAVGTVFNIADCEERIGHLAQAWTFFREVGQRLPPSDERHSIAERRASALEPRLPRLQLHLSGEAPAGARIERDGVELGSASLDSALPVDPGEHRIVVRAAGRDPREFRITLREGESRVVEIAAGREPEVSEAKARPAASNGGSSQRTVGYVIGGVGVAGLVVGAIAGAMTLGKKSTVDANCNPDKQCNATGLDAANSGKKLGLISTIGLAAGAVGLGAGAYLVLSARPAAAEQNQAFSATFVSRW